MKTTKKDPAIERVRKARRQISAECDHNPEKLVAYYQERARRRREQEQQQSQRRDEA